MSAHLYWKPAGDGERIGGPALRDALMRKYMSGHGDHVALDHDSRDFLEGLAAGGVDGAAELLRLIDEHGAIDVWVQG